MASKLSFMHVLAGLGLASTLFLGCQDLMSQGSSSAPATVTDQNTGSLSLKLAVKDSGACLDLKNRIEAAHASGTVLGGADSAFTANCIHEMRGADTGKTVPPALIPDDKSRCQWIRTQIDVGRDEMTIKFRHYCPEDCDTLLGKDSAGQVKYCRDPKRDTVPVKPPFHDTDIAVPPKHDTATINPPKHDTLPTKPPVCDTVPRKPPMDICDTLKLRMSQTVPGTQIHKDQEADFKKQCGEPIHDTIPVQPPVVIPPKTNCDSLRLQLAKFDSASADYARIKHLMGESCPVPKPVPVPVPVKPPVVVPPKVNCDELRAKLSVTDTTTADYARLLGSLRENCPVR